MFIYYLITILLICLQEYKLQNIPSRDERSSYIAFPDEISLSSGQEESYHPAQQQQYHSEYESENRRQFADEKIENLHQPSVLDSKSENNYQPWARVDEVKDANYRSKIPLEYIQTLNKYNVSDLLLNFIDDDGDEGSLFVENRFGSEEADERNAVFTPKSAGCIPELQTVNIAKSEDPSMLYIPQCTRIERCGGCCNHELLTCQPTHTEAVSFRVYKTQYTGAQKLKKVGKEVIQLERHLKCKCDCRIQPQDCTRYQEYRKERCQCVCANRDEEEKCYRSDKKIWNSEACVCECKRPMPCTTGFFFDPNECKCVPNTNRRRYALFDIFDP